MAAVRNVGESLVERIVAERNANGPFVDIFDFCQRVDPVVLNKRTMESLGEGGSIRCPRPPPPGSVPRHGRASSTARWNGGVSTTWGITSLFAAFEDGAGDRSGLGDGEDRYP